MFMPVSMNSTSLGTFLETGPVENEGRFRFCSCCFKNLILLQDIDALEKRMNVNVLKLKCSLTNGADNAGESDLGSPAQDVEIGQVVHGGGRCGCLALADWQVARGQDGLEKKK